MSGRPPPRPRIPVKLCEFSMGDCERLFVNVNPDSLIAV